MTFYMATTIQNIQLWVPPLKIYKIISIGESGAEWNSANIIMNKVLRKPSSLMVEGESTEWSSDRWAMHTYMYKINIDVRKLTVTLGCVKALIGFLGLL